MPCPFLLPCFLFDFLFVSLRRFSPVLAPLIRTVIRTHAFVRASLRPAYCSPTGTLISPPPLSSFPYACARVGSTPYLSRPPCLQFSKYPSPFLEDLAQSRPHPPPSLQDLPQEEIDTRTIEAVGVLWAPSTLLSVISPDRG